MTTNLTELFKYLNVIDSEYLSAVRGTISISSNAEPGQCQDEKAFGGLRVLHSLDKKYQNLQQSHQSTPTNFAEQRRDAKEAVKKALQEARAANIPWHTILTIISRI